MRLYGPILHLLPHFLVALLLHLSATVAANCAAGESCEEQTWQQWLKETINGTNSDPDDDKKPLTVQFCLFTKSNMNKPQTFTLDTRAADVLKDKEIKSTLALEKLLGLEYKSFDPKKTTKIIVHGWMGHLSAKMATTMLKAYLPAKDYNIIVVDWHEKARKFYPTARRAVSLVGRLLADFIDLLCKTYNVKPDKLHVIGHSLGAHVSGLAGRLITTGTIGRITGLDPAAPLFAAPSVDRLRNNSAQFVDVIHSCGKYLGWFDPIGHADFYPNKGVAAQPGCGMDVLGKCSHRRAWMYYAESILKPRQFLAVPCKSWERFERSPSTCSDDLVNMGESIPKITKGVYYLRTNKAEPFGLGINGI